MTMYTQIPNFLTLLRIVMVPVIVVLLSSQQYAQALLVFVVAGITDGLDGWIAKTFNLQSAFGAMLDPLADKLLLVSTYTMLAVLGDIPFWLLVLVVFRDFIIVGGYWLLVAMEKKLEVQPSLISKLNTFFQILLVVLVLINHAGWLMLGQIINITVVVVVFTTVSSGMGYVKAGMQQVSGDDLV